MILLTKAFGSDQDMLREKSSWETVFGFVCSRVCMCLFGWVALKGYKPYRYRPTVT